MAELIFRWVGSFHIEVIRKPKRTSYYCFNFCEPLIQKIYVIRNFMEASNQTSFMIISLTEGEKIRRKEPSTGQIYQSLCWSLWLLILSGLLYVSFLIRIQVCQYKKRNVFTTSCQILMLLYFRPIYWFNNIKSTSYRNNEKKLTLSFNFTFR